MPGFPDRLTTWEYPAPNPDLFRLPIGPETKVYDLDAQRNRVFRQLRSPGRKATVGGKTVELLGLWVDEAGHARAVCRADYAYPEDYGLQIEGMASRKPEKPPFSGQWFIHPPTAFEGRPTQVIGFVRPEGPKPFHFPDRLTVQVPVCEGKRLLGYARFENVPVDRAYEVYFLIPDNRPFWDASPKRSSVATAVTKEVEETPRP